MKTTASGGQASVGPPDLVVKWYRIPDSWRNVSCVSAASTEYYQETHETHETGAIRVQIVLSRGRWAHRIIEMADVMVIGDRGEVARRRCRPQSEARGSGSATRHGCGSEWQRTWSRIPTPPVGWTCLERGARRSTFLRMRARRIGCSGGGACSSPMGRRIRSGPGVWHEFKNAPNAPVDGSYTRMTPLASTLFGRFIALRPPAPTDRDATDGAAQESAVALAAEDRGHSDRL